MSMYYYIEGLIVTKRVRQLLIIASLIVLAAMAKRAFNCGFYGHLLLEGAFGVSFVLTYFREQRRSLYETSYRFLTHWNTFESFLFLGSIVLFMVYAHCQHFSQTLFYGYLNSWNIGVIVGIIGGEWLWQNTALKQMTQEQRQRYWVNYKDTMWA